MSHRYMVRFRGAIVAVVATTMTMGLLVPAVQASSATAQSVQDVETRDQLIADQESLLNVYRCLYNVDTHIIPGGCTNGKPAQDPATPNPFSGTPSQQDVEIRDQLIVTQEALLNAYRCLYDVDTHIVPGGCVGTKPAQGTAEPQATPTVTSTPQVDTSQPKVQVSFASVSYAAEEGTTVQVTVELDAIPNRTVVVPLTATFHGDATTADAGSLPTSVTFGPNEATKSIAIDIANDKQSDPGESITIATGQNLPSGITHGTPSQTTISIIDLGVPTATQSVVDVSVFYCASESRGYNQADLTFETNRMNQVVGGFFAKESSGLSTVRFVPGGVVSPDLDWENMTIAGERDKLYDPNHKGIGECFSQADPPGEYQQFLFLVDTFTGRPSGFAWPNANIPNLGGRNSLAVTSTVEYLYQDPLFCGKVDSRPHRVREQPGPVLGPFNSNLFNVGEGIDCRYITYWRFLYLVGHEIGHSVYRLGHPPGCSIMGRGYTTSDKCPDLSLDESMQIPNLLQGLYIDCVDREALGWPVVPEECSSPPPPVEVSFALASYSAEEGATAQITVELDTVPFRTVTVPLNYTFQGGATAADVGTLPTDVTFGPNDTTKTIDIPVKKDNIDEAGERVEVSLGTSLPTDVTPRIPSQTTVSFTDAVALQVRVSFASTSSTALEGTTAQVTVQLDKAPGRTLVIPITGTYQNGADHTDIVDRQLSATFEAHETTSTFAFEVLSDDTSEPGEGIRFRIEDHTDYVDYDTYLRYARLLPADVSVGTPRSTIVTFIDAAPSAFLINFGSATYAVDEGATAQVIVNLNTAPGSTVTIPLATAFGGGATAADVGTLPTSVIFGPNDTTKTIDIEIFDEGTHDPGESIQIAIGQSLPDGFTIGTPSQSTVNITDNEPPLYVSFASATYSVAEGTTAQITVQLDRAPGYTMYIRIDGTYLNGAGDSDISRNQRGVTFQALETTSTLAFEVLSDNSSELGEGVRFQLEARYMPPGVIRINPSQTVVSFIDVASPGS